MGNCSLKIINNYIVIVEHGEDSDYGYVIDANGIGIGEGTLGRKGVTCEELYHIQFS